MNGIWVLGLGLWWVRVDQGFMSVGFSPMVFLVNQLWLVALNGRVGMVFIGLHTAAATFSSCNRRAFLGVRILFSFFSHYLRIGHYTGKQFTLIRDKPTFRSNLLLLVTCLAQAHTIIRFQPNGPNTKQA